MDEATHVFPSWQLTVKGTSDYQNDFVALLPESEYISGNTGWVSGGPIAALRAAKSLVDGATSEKKEKTRKETEKRKPIQKIKRKQKQSRDLSQPGAQRADVMNTTNTEPTAAEMMPLLLYQLLWRPR